MNIYIDADALVAWEKGEFDLPAWLRARPDDTVKFPATVWQQLTYGLFAWQEDRANKRSRYLQTISAHASVSDFSRRHAVRAAQITAELRQQPIGFADAQIAATAMEDNSDLLSFNQKHFSRIPGLRLAAL